MPDLKDGETVEMKGSGAKPYVIKNTGGLYSCSCPSWRNKSAPIEQRSCKHIIKLRGESAEKERVGNLPAIPVSTVKATAPPVLLANVWTPDINPKGWLISEKLDGVRAWWDGKNFISRLGNIYHAPDWFKEDLPSSALDGELWMGRKMFQKCISIVRRQDKSEHWKEIEYVIFDAPTATGVFTERIECVEVYFRAREKEKKRKLKHMSYLDHKPCTGIKHLKKQLSIIEGYGGEGLMLRDPNSLYVAGRSNTLLKVKSSFEDDATVVSYEAGKGKHEGRVGALNVKLANGIEFALGTGLSDSEREHPPAVGTVVTFRYTELTDEGVPRFARFLRVHVDV